MEYKVRLVYKGNKIIEAKNEEELDNIIKNSSFEVEEVKEEREITEIPWYMR